MSYKTKSLVYFSCFVLAATALHLMNENEFSTTPNHSSELVENQFEEEETPKDVIETELAEK